MQIKSSVVVKFIVPVVVVIGLITGLKSCKPDSTEQRKSNNTLANLSADELQSLGVDGDTPEDTLRTLIGRLNDVRDHQKTLDKQNTELMKENERLRRNKEDVSGQVNEAADQLRTQYDKRQHQLEKEQTRLMTKIQELTDKIKTSSDKHGSDSAGSDIPLGLGLDGMGGSTSGSAIPGSDGLLWVAPADQQTADPRDTSSGKALSPFPSSFLSDNAITRQKAAYEQQVKGYTSEKGRQGTESVTEPVYTLPENSTLTGSRAMTALLGRVPVNGTVTDPYPFKLLIGKDNLTANGIELPDMEGAVVSGTASGDWTLSCVRGQINSITFVFADGTVRTLPKPDNNSNAASQSNGNAGAGGGIGWISDDAGIPCISGERKSNASTYLPTVFGLQAAAAAGEALSAGQYTTQNNVNGLSSALTGDAGQAALGKALSGGMSEMTEWLKQRYGQTFDAVYVPPGTKLAVHITRQLAIDYEDDGRKVRYDFTLPGGVSDSGGLD